MDKVLSKVLALSLLGGISLLLGTIPLKLGQWFNGEDGKRMHETLFSSLLCFGGGLLIATSILHMLPEVSFQIYHPFQTYISVILKSILRLILKKYQPP